MITAILPVTLLVASATAAMPVPKEIGYKQFVLGAELSYLKKTNHLKCTTPRDNVVECEVIGKQTMLEKPIESVSLRFADGHLGEVKVVVYPGRNAFHLVQHGTEVSGPSVEMKRFLGELLGVLRLKLGEEPTVYSENRPSGLPGHIPFYTWKANNVLVTLVQHKPNFDWLTLAFISNDFSATLSQNAQVHVRAEDALFPQRQREEAKRKRKRQSDI